MKSYNKIVAFVISVIAVLFVAANVLIINNQQSESDREYRVEVNRLALQINDNGYDSLDFSGNEYVTNVEKYSNDNSGFYDVSNEYVIREIDGQLYRFDYVRAKENITPFLVISNLVLVIISLMVIAILIYIKLKILKPFDRLKEVPFELSKGNLTVPIKEVKNRFFGRFIWGVDLLRDNIESQKQRELDLQKDKRMLLLSLSHDIKTPLSAIKLYSKALSKGLYKSHEKQLEIAENINAKADEIEGYISQIITASKDDFLSFDVNISEFYLSELIGRINEYYSEKLSLAKINFSVEQYNDCMLKGDIDRCVEILQNIIENAIKYGNGQYINIKITNEDGCCVVSIENSGCTLADNELTHIFDSFHRGTNSKNIKGSGLGLYICRQLITKMGGEIFAEIKHSNIIVSTVFLKA